MSISQINCPHCLALINLPPQMEIARDAHQGKGNYIVIADPNEKMPCPNCGRGIRVGDILERKHDPKPAGMGEILLGFGLLALIGFGVYACAKG